MSADAVKAFYEGGKETLPYFVPAMPSMYFGMYCGGIVLLLGLGTCLTDRHLMKESDDVIERTRWMIVLLLTLYLSAVTMDYARDRHYKFASVSLNKQHFANVAWLREYMKAFTLS
jgi:hypothetical protein